MIAPKLGVKRSHAEAHADGQALLQTRDLASRFSSKADLYRYMVGPSNLALSDL